MVCSADQKDVEPCPKKQPGNLHDPSVFLVDHTGKIDMHHILCEESDPKKYRDQDISDASDHFDFMLRIPFCHNRIIITLKR